MSSLLAASPLDPAMPRASATAQVREQKSHGDLPFMWNCLLGFQARTLKSSALPHKWNGVSVTVTSR